MTGGVCRALRASKSCSAGTGVLRFFIRHRYFVISLLVVSSLYVGYFWYHYLFATPVDLYHRTWDACKQNIFDKAALKDWSRYEHRFDRLIKNDDDALRYANQMLQSIGDPYTHLMSAKAVDHAKQQRLGRFVGLGVQINGVKKNGDYLMIDKVIPGSPASRAHLRPGDTILGIAGRSCRGLTAPGFAELTEQYKNQTVSLLIQRSGRKLRLQVAPGVVSTDNIEFKKIADGVGLLNVRNFIKADTGARIMKIVANAHDCSNVILDLRDNPGGNVSDCLQVASLFLDHGRLVTLDIRNGGGIVEESHVLTRDCEEVIEADKSSGTLKVSRVSRLPQIFKNTKLIILVNEHTASAAEMLTAALKENGRALVVGTKTFGKGIAQAGVPIANGAVLCITCVRYFTPAGHFIGAGRQQKGDGLQPDVVVENRVDGIDAQLNTVLSMIRNPS